MANIISTEPFMTFTRGRRLVLEDWADSPEEALENHFVVEAQDPPTLVGDNDVLLRVRSCAVGWVDLIMATGQYQHAIKPPYTPGLEFAGDVVAVGRGVQRVRPGDAVLADGLRTGPRSSGGYRDGGFATYAVIPEDAAIPLPGRLDYDQAVNLLGNFETAYHGLVHRARVQPGEFVLIHGASGSTGLAAVQVSKLLGATVIATGRNADKLAEVSAAGADHVLQLSDTPSFKAEVKALTGGLGAHVVWDGVGGPVSEESLRSMRFGGRFCIIGWAATPAVAKGRGEGGSVSPNVLPTNLIQIKGLDVLGCPAVIATKFQPGLRETRLKWLLERVSAGEITPHVGAIYSFDEWREALESKWRSRHVGGCVLRPA